MKIAAISDVHVKIPFDKADHLLCTFLDHPLVKESELVLLLGDIFDLMCGPHEEYIRLYQHIFDRLEKLHHQGKRVYFFEGNHDVHLQGLFRRRWKKSEIKITQDPLTETIEGKSYYFSHGDEHETDNLSYQRYKKFILSAPLKFVANHVMPYKVLNFVGERASERSRKKGSKLFDENLVRERFRKGVIESTKGKYDFVLGGHSHVQDIFNLPGSHSTYINNGYALKTKTFIFIENHIPRFVSLM